MSRVARLSVLLCMVFALVVTACGGAPVTPAEPPTVAREPTTATAAVQAPDEVDWDDRTVFRDGLIEAQQGILDDLPGATVYHLDLLIPDDFLILEGHEEVSYTNREGQPLNEVYFRLFPNTSGGKVTVSGVAVDGQTVQGQNESEGSAFHVPLPVALEPGEEVMIEMDFEVEVPREMGGNYGLFGYFNDILVLDEFYPAIPVYDDEGWNVEVPPPAGDLTYFDASFYLVQVTAPTDLVVVASGVRVGQGLEEGRQVLTFAAGPARDFYIAASNRYAVISERVGETTINSYAFSEHQEHAQLALQYAVQAMDSFNERFGAYPYVEFDVASTPMQALGIEYPGVAGIGLHLYDPEAEVSGLPSQVLLQGGVAHEIAHQWFYNVVGNDQVDEPWLDEALVQYVTGLYYLDIGGEGAMEGFSRSWRDRWQSVEMADIPIGLPSGEYSDASEYGAVVYGRGPLFMEALADRMGEETFGEFLRDYYSSHQWGIGTGEAFRQLAEEHCQCDLASLFEGWVYEK